KVWSTANLKRWLLVKEPRMWRDRSVLEIPADKLDHVELEYANAKVIARKEAPASQPASDASAPKPPQPPEQWIVTEGQDKIGGPVDDGVAANLASTLARLEAEDIVDLAKPDAENGLDHPRVSVTATLKDGATKTLLIGKDSGPSTFAMLKDNPR